MSLEAVDLRINHLYESYICVCALRANSLDEAVGGSMVHTCDKSSRSPLVERQVGWFRIPQDTSARYCRPRRQDGQ